MWLFLFNAAYAAAFFTYSVATNVYSRTHGLIRDYELNEADADPQFYMLKRWARVNQHAVFWLQQVCTILCSRQTLSDQPFTHILSPLPNETTAGAFPRLLARDAGVRLLLPPRSRPEPRGAGATGAGAHLVDRRRLHP